MKWVPDWILKLFGKKIAANLGLEEDAKMDSKPWFKSKGVWTAILGGLVGVYGAISAVHPLPPIPEWVLTLLASMGLYTLRTADTKIS